MKDYSEIEEILNNQNITQDDQKIVRDFLSSFSFTKRQQLIGIFLGHEEKLSLFIGLLKKKMEFTKNPTEELSREILEIESREIKTLIKELE